MEELTITPNRDRKQHIWVEKYRPKSLSEYIGSDKKREDLKNIIYNIVNALDR